MIRGIHIKPALLLTTALTIGLGVSAYAADTLQVGGIDIDPNTDSYWKLQAETSIPEETGTIDDYDFKIENGELYLNLKEGQNLQGTTNAPYGAAIYAEGRLTIQMEQDSTVSGINNVENSAGIYILDGSLTVKGDGTLTTQGGSITGEKYGDYGSYGIYVYSKVTEVSVTVLNNANVDAKGSYDTGVYGKSYGIYAESLPSNVKITAKGGGNITANALSCGIYAYSVSNNSSIVRIFSADGSSIKSTASGEEKSTGIYISNSKHDVALIADNGIIEGEGNFSGIVAQATFIRENSDATITIENQGSIKGTAFGEYGSGINVQFHVGKINLNKGSIVANGYTGIDFIWHPDGDSAAIINIKDSTVTVNATDDGISFSGGYSAITVENSTITATTSGENSRGISLSASSGESSSIEIYNSTITATATGENSRGIYNLNFYNNSDISIQNSSIYAKGTKYGICNYYADTLEITDGTLLFAEGDEAAMDKITWNETASNGILFENGAGSLLTSDTQNTVIPWQDFQIPKEYILTVKKGECLDLADHTLTNQGTLCIYNTESLRSEANLKGNGTFEIEYDYPIINAPETLTYTGFDLSSNINLCKPNTVDLYGKDFFVKNIIGAGQWTRTFTKDNIEIDKIIDAGTYQVNYSYNDGIENHIITDEVTVKKAVTDITLTTTPQSPSAGEDIILAVATTPANVTYSLFCDNPNIPILDNGNGTFTAKLPNKTATYTFTAICAESENYLAATDSTTITVTEKVRPDITLTATKQSLTGGGEVTFSLNTSPADMPCTLSCSDPSIDIVDNGDGTFTAVLPNKTASYKFIASCPESEHYFEAQDSLTIIVTRNIGSDGSSIPSVYTVTFDTNGGEEMKKFRWKEYTTIDPEDYIPKREGYTFLGWYLDQELEEAADPFTLRRDVILYAKWEKDTQAAELPTESTLSFADMLVEDWFYDAVSYCVAHGMMSGMSETIFAPDAPFTREMLATVLYQLEGKPTHRGDLVFSDVDASLWYTDGVLWAYQNGIVAGYGNGTFGIGQSITREEFATMLHNYAQYRGYDATLGNMVLWEFTDEAMISSYAKNAMTWAVKQGILNGLGDGTLAPLAVTTRAEAAQMLMVFCQIYTT